MLLELYIYPTAGVIIGQKKVKLSTNTDLAELDVSYLIREIRSISDLALTHHQALSAEELLDL